VISVGAGNPYGHPRAGTLRTLDGAGVRVWRTDRSGDVTIERTPAGLSVGTEG
jgi:competence protein ComEC